VVVEDRLARLEAMKMRTHHSLGSRLADCFIEGEKKRKKTDHKTYRKGKRRIGIGRNPTVLNLRLMHSVSSAQGPEIHELSGGGRQSGNGRLDSAPGMESEAFFEEQTKTGTPVLSPQVSPPTSSLTNFISCIL